MNWEGLNSADLARTHCGSKSIFPNLYHAEKIDMAFNCRSGRCRGNVCWGFIKICDAFSVIIKSHVIILCNFFRNLGGAEKCLKTWLKLKLTWTWIHKIQFKTLFMYFCHSFTGVWLGLQMHWGLRHTMCNKDSWCLAFQAFMLNK